MIGIDTNTLLVYEGNPSLYGRGVWPTPFISQATLITCDDDWKTLPPRASYVANPKLIFREDSFDPVTRIRRGRLYQWHDGALQRDWYNVPHSATPYSRSELTPNGIIRMRLHTYTPKTDLASQFSRTPGMLIVLGAKEAGTVWRLLAVENGFMGEDIVTLRARSSFGALPEINPDAIPADAQHEISNALDKVVDAKFRSGPESLIDMCRAAATLVLSHWLISLGENKDAMAVADVGDLLKAVERQFHGEGEMPALKAAIRLLQRFHSRGKPNEQKRYNTRPPNEDDAELVLQALGFIIREIGWSK